MKREIIEKTATCERIAMDDFASDPIKWLATQMGAHKLRYLLAHADDGVIWGRLDEQGLITSHDVAPEHSPSLRVETLQTVRAFADTGELLVWRNEDGAWAGRLITEVEDASSGAAEWTQAFNEKQILWGTDPSPCTRDFTVMSDGSQGLIHVVPLEVCDEYDEQTRPHDEKTRPLQLVVRHYLKEDDNGFVRVNASRLVDLQQKEGKK